MRSLKSELPDAIRSELRVRLERLTQAARDSHAAATDAGSKAESKYDTRNLEASYLAAGQSRQVMELAEAVRAFETLALPDFHGDAAIDAGALVEADFNGEAALFLLAPASGGLEVVCRGREVTLLTPESPLYRKLLGMRAGDQLDQPALRVTAVC